MKNNSSSISCDTSHVDEWVNYSMVDEAIATANIQTVSGEDVFTRLYPNAKRLNAGKLNTEYERYYEKCADSTGWWVANIDPQTGVETGWGQFKADSGAVLATETNKDGDKTAVKYRSPKGMQCEPLCLKVPQSYTSELAAKLGIDYNEESYWKFILNHVNVPLFVTEGAKKAACLISHGLPAVALAGVNNWSVTNDDGSKTLHPTLELLTEHREVVLCFDNDVKTKARLNVKNAVEKLAIELKQAKAVHVCYPPAAGFSKTGVDDYFANGGTVKGLLSRKLPFTEWQNPFKSKYLKARTIHFQDSVGGRVRLNQMTSEVEFDDRPINWDTFRRWFAVNVFNHPLSNADFDEIIRFLAEENSYNPIKDYLESLDTDIDFDLDSVASLFFGVEQNSIQSTLVRKWLISAVARTYDPGCKADSALILYEPVGGVGKSSFFRALCPDPSYFCDDMGDINNKDERIKMHQNWIIEWAELDGVFGMKASSAVKSFLSCSTDNIRPPYGRATQKMKRRSIICGTTNKRELLPETSGQRRYWVVEVKGHIKVEDVKLLRDQIWGAAVKAYKDNEKWWLTFDEERMNDVILTSHVSDKPYQDEVEDFIAGIKEKGLDRFPFESLKDKVHPGNNSPKFSKLIKSILEDLGWESKRYRDNYGKLTRGYVKRGSVDSDRGTVTATVTEANASDSKGCSDSTDKTNFLLSQQCHADVESVSAICDSKNGSKTFQKNIEGVNDEDSSIFAKSFEELSHCHSSSKCSQGWRDSSCDSKKPDESYCHTNQRADLVPMGLDVGAAVLVYDSFTGVIIRRASDNSPNFFVKYHDETGKEELDRFYFTALKVITDSVS